MRHLEIQVSTYNSINYNDMLTNLVENAIFCNFNKIEPPLPGLREMK